ncbi:MAG: hypothetical protein AAGD33_12555 [Actinomycetota bacterium]
MERFRSVDDVAADDALIESLQRDGAAVMDGWWERFSGPIAAVLSRRNGGTDVSETVVHQPLEELRARRAELRAGVDPSPLILSLTVASAGGDVTVSPDDQWIWMVRSCLDSLPPPRRAIARRRWLDGSDAQQIADELARDPIEINDELGRVGRRLDSQLGLPGSVLSELLIDPATWAEASASLGDPSVDEAPPVADSTHDATHDSAGAAHLADAPAEIGRRRSGGLDSGGRLVDAGQVATAEPDADPVEAAESPRPRRSTGRFGRVGLLLGGAALAIVVLFVLLVALSAGDELERMEVASVDLTPTGLVDEVEGSLTISTSDVGVTYELDLSPLPELPDDGSVYRVVLALDDGSFESVASFLQGASFDAVSATPLGSVDELRIVDGDRASRDDVDLDGSRVLLRADVSAAVVP